MWEMIFLGTLLLRQKRGITAIEAFCVRHTYVVAKLFCARLFSLFPIYTTRYPVFNDPRLTLGHALFLGVIKCCWGLLDTFSIMVWGRFLSWT